MRQPDPFSVTWSGSLSTGVAGAAALLSLSLADPAHAQLVPFSTNATMQISTPSVLPDTGTTTSADSLRQELQSLDAVGTEKTPLTPGWIVSPSIAVNQEWASHIQGAGNPSAFVTVVQPGVLATGDTSRLHSVISYMPEAELFVPVGDQNRIGQNFNADGLVTIVPERLFLDLRGFGTVQSAVPGTGPSNTVVLSRANEVQTQSYSVRPYLLERIGDWGSGELGATASYTSLNSLSASQSSTSVNQDATMEREYISVASGPQLGRLDLNGLASAMQAVGTGVMSGAYRDEGDIESGFAITRNITALAGVGEQDIHYGGFPNYNFTGLQWDVGVNLIPNADSSLTIRYGRRDGVMAPQIDGKYAPSARSRIYVRYSEGITTEQELLQTAINGSVLDPLGSPVDPQTGTPLLLVNNFYGVQNNLALVKRGSMTGTLLFDRDSFSVSIGLQKSRQLAAPTLSAAGSANTTAAYGTINWQHEFVGQITSSVFFQYGTTNQVALRPGLSGPTSGSILFSVGLTYPIFRTLNGLLQYAYSSQPGAGLAGLPPTSFVLVGVKKTF